MSTLQKVNLGTPPTAVDGDTVRGANTKANANVDVLNAQTTLTSAAATITSAQALTAAHVGKRVNINLAAAGTIQVPSAATMGLDGVVHLRNTGSTLVTLAITAGSGDTLALTKLAAGESALLDSDGTHAIGCLFRGRANGDNESIVGNLAVGGSVSLGGVSGPLSATGNIGSSQSIIGAGVYAIGSSGAAGTTRGIFLGQGTAGALRWSMSSEGTSETGGNVGSNFLISRYSDAGAYVDSPVTITRSTGAVKVSGQSTVTVPGTGNVASASLLVDGLTSYPYLGLYGFNRTVAVQARVLNNTSTSAIEFVSYNAAAYSSVNASAFTVSSDIAFKTEVQDLPDVMEKLRTKRAKSYVLKANPEIGRKIGVIAQDWVEDFPELVNETAEIDEDGDFISHQYAPVVEITKEEPVLDEEGNETGEIRRVGTGLYTGGEEIFGPNGPPKCRKALGFEYANGFAVLLKALQETDASLQAALQRIAALEGKA